MRPSTGAQASCLLALVAACFVTEAQSMQRTTVRTHKTNYRVDSWDDDRDEPYRVTFWKYGLQSVYTFDVTGHVKTLVARDTKYAFDLDAPSRMLVTSDDDRVQDVDVGFGSLVSCADCDATFTALCDVGLAEVCFLDDINRENFDGDATDSVRRFCSGFGAACEMSTAGLCEDGGCLEAVGYCDPNPCENGGSCFIDPEGGHVCSCAEGYGGMACDIDTSDLASFFIEFDFIGAWTDARRAVFQSAASWWSETITHVPCGGSPNFPAGRLLINATLEEIDGVGGVLGSAGPTSVWDACDTIAAAGNMRFDIDDIANLEADGGFNEVIVSKMGYVIGIETLWGDGFGDCITYHETGDPTWTCPAVLSMTADIVGSDSGIDESGGGSDNSDDATAVVHHPTYQSKITAAILEDLKYVVNPTEAGSSSYAGITWQDVCERSGDYMPMTMYVVFCMGIHGTIATGSDSSGSQIKGDPGPSAVIDNAVDAIIIILDDDGDSVDERVGVAMEF